MLGKKVTLLRRKDPSVRPSVCLSLFSLSPSLCLSWSLPIPLGISQSLSVSLFIYPRLW